MSSKGPSSSSGRYVSRLTSGTLAIIMAGGRGERLKQLTQGRAKPATPFGGKFRIIDFVLSNCVNSGIRQISVLTQYKAQSLIEHVQRGWGYLRGEFGEFIDVVPAQQQTGAQWYQGTADAVYQNLEYIRAHRPKHVLVLAGDHIYKMDYGPMIAYHVEKNADITIGVVEVPVETAREFGVLSVTEWNRVVKFAEKPAQPEPVPGRADTALASMGIYVFNARLLDKLLSADAARTDSQHDFGKNIIPAALSELQVFALRLSGRQDARASVLARRRHARCVLRSEHGASVRRPGTEYLRRRVADLDLPIAAATGEVRARRGCAAWHCDQFARGWWLHHLWRAGARIAALFRRARRGTLDRADIDRPAASFRWPQLHDPPRHS